MRNNSLPSVSSAAGTHSSGDLSPLVQLFRSFDIVRVETADQRLTALVDSLVEETGRPFSSFVSSLKQEAKARVSRQNGKQGGRKPPKAFAEYGIGIAQLEKILLCILVDEYLCHLEGTQPNKNKIYRRVHKAAVEAKGHNTKNASLKMLQIKTALETPRSDLVVRRRRLHADLLTANGFDRRMSDLSTDDDFVVQACLKGLGARAKNIQQKTQQRDRSR